MLAYGVVFVLLLGEIDLSIAYLAASRACSPPSCRSRAAATCSRASRRSSSRSLIATAIGAFQGSFVAIIGVPAFVVTLAGLLAWQGAIQVTLGAGGPIIIQNRWINYTANYPLRSTWVWGIAIVVSAAYVASFVSSVLQQRRHGVDDPRPWLLLAQGADRAADRARRHLDREPATRTGTACRSRASRWPCS